MRSSPACRSPLAATLVATLLASLLASACKPVGCKTSVQESSEDAGAGDTSDAGAGDAGTGDAGTGDAGSACDTFACDVAPRLAAARSDFREPVGSLALFQTARTLWGVRSSEGAMSPPVATEAVGGHASALLLRSHAFGAQPEGRFGVWGAIASSDFAFAYRDVASVADLAQRIEAFTTAPSVEAPELRWLREMDRADAFLRAVPDGGLRGYVSYQDVFFEERGRCGRAELQRSAAAWARTITEHAFRLGCKGTFCRVSGEGLALEIDPKQHEVLAVAQPLRAWEEAGDACAKRIAGGKPRDEPRPAREVSAPPLSASACEKVGPPASLVAGAELCALYHVSVDDGSGDPIRVSRLASREDDGRPGSGSPFPLLVESRRTGPLLVKGAPALAPIDPAQISVRVLRDGATISLVELAGREFPRRVLRLDLRLAEGALLSDDDGAWDPDLYLATDADDFVKRKLHPAAPTKTSQGELCRLLQDLKRQDDDEKLASRFSKGFEMYQYGEPYRPSWSPSHLPDDPPGSGAPRVRDALFECGRPGPSEVAAPGCTDAYCYDESRVPDKARIWFTREGGRLKLRLIVTGGGP